MDIYDLMRNGLKVSVESEIQIETDYDLSHYDQQIELLKWLSRGNRIKSIKVV